MLLLSCCLMLLLSRCVGLLVGDEMVAPVAIRYSSDESVPNRGH
jgi:hypothetical protein